MAIRKILMPISSYISDEAGAKEIDQAAHERREAEADAKLDALLMDGWTIKAQLLMTGVGSQSALLILFKDTRVKLPQFDTTSDGGMGMYFNPGALGWQPEGDKIITTEEAIKATPFMSPLSPPLVEAIGTPLPTDNVLKPLHEISTPIAVEDLVSATPTATPEQGFVPRLS